MDEPASQPGKVGARSTRTETTIRQYNADGLLVSETTQTQITWVADDKAFPEGGYL